MKTKRISIILCLVAILCLLAGCGGADNNDNNKEPILIEKEDGNLYDQEDRLVKENHEDGSYDRYVYDIYEDDYAYRVEQHDEKGVLYKTTEYWSNGPESGIEEYSVYQYNNDGKLDKIITYDSFDVCIRTKIREYAQDGGYTDKAYFHQSENDLTFLTGIETYDAQGRFVLLVDYQGDRETRRIERVYHEDGSATQYEYDSLGNRYVFEISKEDLN